MSPKRTPGFYLILAAGPALLLLGLVARLLPTGLQPTCMSHRLTGFPCPGCGSYRALSAFTAGHWLTAFLTQPLMTLLFAAAVAGSAGALLFGLLRKPAPAPPAIPEAAWKWLVAGGIAAVLLNWLYLIRAGV